MKDISAADMILISWEETVRERYVWISHCDFKRKSARI